MSVTQPSTAGRIRDAAARVGADWALLVGADRVRYATGHVVAVEAGTSPFAGGPTTAVVDASARTGLVTANVEPATAATTVAAVYDGVSLRRESFTQNYLRALDDVLDQLEVAGPVAVEAALLPATVERHLRTRGHELVDAAQVFAEAQMVKTPVELETLTRSARLVDRAHEAALAVVTPGMTELALFNAIRFAVEDGAGERTPFTGDVLSGVDRTSGVGGWPVGRTLHHGDPIILDLAPRVDGYWADSCNSFTLGTATPAYRRLHALVLEALQVAEDAVRVGATVGSVDHAARSFLRTAGHDYPHHTGHGIGASVHEHPRIIPDAPTRLEADMVVLLEPGAYEAGTGGVRLERMYRVTDDGPVPLTTFPMLVQIG